MAKIKGCRTRHHIFVAVYFPEALDFSRHQMLLQIFYLNSAVLQSKITEWRYVYSKDLYDAAPHCNFLRVLTKLYLTIIMAHRLLQ